MLVCINFAQSSSLRAVTANMVLFSPDFDYPRGAILGVFANMQVIGGAVSLPLAPWAADRFGRRHPIAFGSFVIILGGFVQGFAQNFAMFLAGRFCIGLGAGFVSTAAPPLLGELSYPSHRPIFTSIYNCCWVSRNSVLTETNSSLQAALL